MRNSIVGIMVILALTAVLSRQGYRQPPSQSKPAVEAQSLSGFSLSGFQPGMDSKEILRQNPEMFQMNGQNRLVSEKIALVLDKEGKVLYVEGGPGSIVEMNGLILFRFSAGYFQAKTLLAQVPNTNKLSSTIQKTEVQLGSQVIRLEHKYQTGPQGNKGLLASVILYAKS